MSYNLKLTRRQAMTVFNDLRGRLANGFLTSVDEKKHVGRGRYDHDTKTAELGIKEIYGSGLSSFFLVSDEDFTDAVIALYHEYGHHLDNCSSDVSKAIIFSTISTYYNPGYRNCGWREFPHEISAERTGVLFAYDVMGGLFGQAGRVCVMNHVADRILNTSYVLQLDDVPELPDLHDGSDRAAPDWTRDDLENAFDKAMSRSLERKREPQPGLRRYEHDRMSGFFRCPEGIPYFRKFIDEVPGAVKDRMAASVNIHIDPDLMDPRLDPEDVDMDATFGMPGPPERSPLMRRCFDMSESRPGQPRSDMQGPDP